jgi:hypothetical protein
MYDMSEHFAEDVPGKKQAFPRHLACRKKTFPQLSWSEFTISTTYMVPKHHQGLQQGIKNCTSQYLCAAACFDQFIASLIEVGCA